MSTDPKTSKPVTPAQPQPSQAIPTDQEEGFGGFADRSEDAKTPTKSEDA
jgi:hypothetical protein